MDQRLPVHAHIPALPARTLEALSVRHVQVDAVEAAQAVRASRQDAAGQAAAQRRREKKKSQDGYPRNDTRTWSQRLQPEGLVWCVTP